MIHEKNEIVKISDALKAENEENGSKLEVKIELPLSGRGASRTLYVVPSLGIDPVRVKGVYVNRFMAN